MSSEYAKEQLKQAEQESGTTYAKLVAEQPEMAKAALESFLDSPNMGWAEFFVSQGIDEGDRDGECEYILKHIDTDEALQCELIYEYVGLNGL